MVKRLLPILAASLLFAVAQVHALSLGDITLESAAGEPLQARIQLLDVDGLSVSDISAMVASAADFERFDTERIAALDSFNVSVEFVDGAPVLLISSPVSIDEPFLSLVLDTRWPAGRVLTEYTLRLESPAFSARNNQQVTAAPVQSEFVPVQAEADDNNAEPEVTAELAQSESSADANGSDVTGSDASESDAPGGSTSPATGVATAADQAPNEPAQSEPAQTAPAAAPADLANASTLTVNAGDTLWELALRARPDDSVSVQQTMLALQRLNPDAFLGDNINRVKRGEVLRVPELSQIRQLAAAEAIAEVTRQNLAFRQGSTGSVGSEPVTAGPGAATPGAEQGQLRVVTADDESEDSADATASAASAQSAEQEIARNDEQLEALEDSMAQREEELDRLELENTELNSRLAMLQQQIASAQEIIRLRDLELAQLQAQLAEADPADTAPDDAEEQTTTITMAPDAGPVERFFNSLISNTWALLAVAAVLVLLLVLVLMRRNRATLTDEQRAQRENDEMPLGDDSDDELLFSGVAAAAAAANAENQDDSDDDGVTYTPSGAFDTDTEEEPLADEEPSAGEEPSADEEPSAYEEPSAGEEPPAGMPFDESTVFDDEFALDDTLEVDPEADDPFATSAATDDAGPDWGDTDLDLEDDIDDVDEVDGPAEPQDDDELSWPDEDAAGETDGSADYDISDEAADQAEVPDTPPENIPVPESEPAPEPAPQPEPDPAPEPATKVEDDFEDLAFISNEDSFDDDEEDDEDEDFAFLSDSDEAATKLDLARAYIDMGDSDGAREILSEVVQEGTEAQRRDAESLLARL